MPKIKIFKLIWNKDKRKVFRLLWTEGSTAAQLKYENFNQLHDLLQKFNKFII